MKFFKDVREEGVRFAKKAVKKPALFLGIFIIGLTGFLEFFTDFSNLFADRFWHFLIPLAAAGVLANTSLDEQLYQGWQRKFGNNQTINRLAN